jgi:hypothetical protein
MAKSKPVTPEFKVLDTTLSGAPLVFTKLVESADGWIRDEPVLTTAEEVRLTVTATEGERGTYFVELTTPKGHRGFVVSTAIWLNFSGLPSDGGGSLSVDGDTEELVFRIR